MEPTKLLTPLTLPSCYFSPRLMTPTKPLKSLRLPSGYFSLPQIMPTLSNPAELVISPAMENVAKLCLTLPSSSTRLRWMTQTKTLTLLMLELPSCYGPNYADKTSNATIQKT